MNPVPSSLVYHPTALDGGFYVVRVEAKRDAIFALLLCFCTCLIRVHRRVKIVIIHLRYSFVKTLGREGHTIGLHLAIVLALQTKEMAG
jgi:hypothetical protein